MQRADGRSFRQHRSVEVVAGFHRNAEGSVLYRCGRTVVLCTASVDASVPNWMVGSGKGWLTAEYQMHPRSSPAKRESRDGRGKAPSGRTQEIQRLIGRALRAAVDLDRLGERSVTIDCDVLEADGGTRTASISGGFIALGLSVGYLEPKAGDSGEGALALDLDYREDSRARVDLNLVATAKGGVVEVQGTAEGAAIPRAELDRMIDLGLEGTESLCRTQREILAASGVDLAGLLVAG